MRKGVSEILLRAIQRAQKRGELAEGEIPPIDVEYPRDERYGDYASSIAMAIASQMGEEPKGIAQVIIKNIEDPGGIIDRAEIGGPGFINLYLKEAYWHHFLREADRLQEDYGAGDLGKGKRVLVEFLSANPTGPLHIGHGRIAAFGDTLANLLAKVGYMVEREYYINDKGTQLRLLGESVLSRYGELFGEDIPLPQDGYQGGYIKDIARDIKGAEGDRYLKLPRGEAIALLGDKAAGEILVWIKEDLERFRVRFDRWYHEKELYQRGEVERVLGLLRQKGFLYEQGGAIWFKSTLFGDEKDRVVIRGNEEETYFASDIAYHQDKYDRGYDLIIDIWGADHHGYVPRMQGAIEALGHDRGAFRVILVQLVNLVRDKRPVGMSTRSGEFTSLREVIDEVGIDACRYFFMLRRAESPLDFDLELAKRQEADNPVYYVQYAHARVSSLFKKAARQGLAVPNFDQVDISLLKLPEERLLAKRVAIFPELLEGMALAMEPHRLTSYLQDLAAAFHSYYNRHRIISEDRGLTQARLLLSKLVKDVVRSALGIIGVDAPTEM